LVSEATRLLGQLQMRGFSLAMRPQCVCRWDLFMDGGRDVIQVCRPHGVAMHQHDEYA
jgi:hypothetical protein